MDFSIAVRASTADRERIIRSEIEDNYDVFADLLNDEHMEHGGFPDDVMVDNVTIFYKDSEEIMATVSIQFSECISTACADVSIDHSGTAEFRVLIDAKTGMYEIDDEPEVDIDDDFQVYSGDYL